ncbi:MAG: hypothetical protein KatS3mg108_0415 [Isosphaeraceae bacterium]|jgi:Uma2 family endonuclease|nr:MAG: hypothetical protein KatS3mg108_0415 [Isosphaeraceae bacterium]
MSSLATRPAITADQFLAMELGDGLHELVRGAIVAMAPPPGPEHGYYCLAIAAALRDYGRRTGHGYALTNDVAIRIRDDTVRGADVCYYSHQRLPRHRLGPQPAPVPPELVAEVLSPHQPADQVIEKVADYLHAGVATVCVVDPRQRTITVYRRDNPTPRLLGPGQTLDAIPELPGFSCPVADLFA